MKITKNNIIIVFIFILIIFGGIYVAEKQNPKVNKKEPEKIKILDNYNKFFTISNAASSYIRFLNNEDQDNVYLLLNDEYKKENNITKENIISKLDFNSKNGLVMFEAKKIYYENINDNNIKYYLFGYINVDQMNTYSDKEEEYYLIINLDTKNQLFDVVPYDGEIFMEKL